MKDFNVIKCLEDAHELLVAVIQDVATEDTGDVSHDLIRAVNDSADMTQSAIDLSHDLGYSRENEV